MMYGTHEEFKYILCSNCGCLQLSEIPFDIQRHYPARYYSYSEVAEQSISPFKDILKRARLNYYLSPRGILGKILVNFVGDPILPKWIRTAQLKSNHKILDVGCGSGELLVALRGEGFTKLTGIDPYINKDIIYKNGVSIFKKELTELNHKYDVVMFHHSFEHMADPAAVLNSLRKILSASGRVIMRIPIVSSFAWRNYKTDWVQIDAPRHLYLHSLNSMEILANNSGFKIDQIEYDSNANQFWGSEQIKKGISYMDERSYRVNPDKSIFGVDEISEFKIRAETLNKNKDGDQAIFYISKLS